MKKIKSREEIESQQKRMKLIISVLIIFLMVFSTAGFALFNGSGISNNQEIEQENGYYNGRYYVYQQNGKEFYFTNSIEETQGVQIELSHTLNSYSGSPVFFISDNDVIFNEVSLNLGQFVPRIQRACLEECDEDLPEKECTENLIVYNEAEENKVYQDENCVFIEGDLIAVDAFLYKVLGIN